MVNCKGKFQLKMNYSILIMIIIMASYLCDDSYYQIMKEYSFNLKNTNDSNLINSNFEREGEAIIYDKFIMLTPRKNESYGLIYTKGEIITENVEVQIKFRINSTQTHGSAFAVWFFADEMNSTSLNVTDRRQVGFKPDFNGIGIYLFTPSKNTVDPRSFIFVQQNNGKLLDRTGFKEIEIGNSCNENFQNRTVKLTLKYELTEKNLAISFDNNEYLHYPCMSYIKLQNSQPRYRIGISSMNGVIDGEQYMDNVIIEKLSIFNMMENKKTKYTTLRNSPLQVNHKIENVDLVEYLPKFLNNFNLLNDVNYLKTINSKLDNALISLSDIKNNLQIKENFDNNSELPKNLHTISDSYKHYISQIQKQIQEFKEQLLKKEFSSALNNSVNHINESGITERDYEKFIEDIYKIKKEWENNKIRYSLSNQLNSMISDKIDQVTKSLKLTEGTHSKLAAKLNEKLTHSSGYISQKIDTNYLTFCIVLILVIVNIVMLFWLYHKFNKNLKTIKNT